MNPNLEPEVRRKLNGLELKKVSAIRAVMTLENLTSLKEELSFKENLKLMIIEQNPKILAQVAKRSLLYADFIIIMPLKNYFSSNVRKRSKAIYIDSPDESIKWPFQIESAGLGIYFPPFFINCQKCSSETKIIVNGDLFTLGQLYSLLYSWNIDNADDGGCGGVPHRVSFVEDAIYDFLDDPKIANDRFKKYKERANYIKMTERNYLNSTKLMSLSPKPFSFFSKDIINNSMLFPRALSRSKLNYSSTSIGEWLRLTQSLNKENKSFITKSLLSIDLPFLEGVTFETLIKTRIREWESFILFRKALFDVVQQLKQIYPHENPKKIAKRIKEDILLPALIKLNRQFKKTVTYRVFRLATFTTTPLILNVIPGDIAYEMIAKAFYSMFSGTALEAIELWKEVQEIKENEIYFLWKLGRYSNAKSLI